MRIKDYDNEEYLEELDKNKFSKYKKRNKKIKESFTLKDLLSEEQIQDLNKYVE